MSRLSMVMCVASVMSFGAATAHASPPVQQLSRGHDAGIVYVRGGGGGHAGGSGLGGGGFHGGGASHDGGGFHHGGGFDHNRGWMEPFAWDGDAGGPDCWYSDSYRRWVCPAD